MRYVHVASIMLAACCPAAAGTNRRHVTGSVMPEACGRRTAVSENGEVVWWIRISPFEQPTATLLPSTAIAQHRISLFSALGRVWSSVKDKVAMMGYVAMQARRCVGRQGHTLMKLGEGD